MDADTIPRELRDLPQWVLYRVQARNGKTTKVPVPGRARRPPRVGDRPGDLGHI